MSKYSGPKIPWSQAENDALISMASECSKYGGRKTYGAIAAELSREVGTNPQLQPRRGRVGGVAEFNAEMVRDQLARLEKRKPELMPKTGRTMFFNKSTTPKHRDELEDEGFIVVTAKDFQTKKEINWHPEELQLLSQLALNTQASGGIEDDRSIASTMNAMVTSKTLPKLREYEYTEQLIRDLYQCMMDRGWKPPTLTEKKAIEKGSNRSTGRSQWGKSPPVNEPSMAGSSGSHVQQQKLPTFEPPSQATKADRGLRSGAPSPPEVGSAIGSHGHQGPPQHTNQKVPTFEAPSQEATMAFSGPSGLSGFGSRIGSHGQVSLQHNLPGIGSSIFGAHGTNRKLPTYEPPIQEATMAVLGPSGRPGIGSVSGSHSYRGTPQQVNAPAMMGTSSAQHLHDGAQHASRGFPPPTSSQRPFHPLNDHDRHDHHVERGPDLRPITGPMGRCNLDSEPGGSHEQSHQQIGKGKIPALEPELRDN